MKMTDLIICYFLEMIQGRIERVRLLWVNRENPNEVNSNLKHLYLAFFSTFLNYELKLENHKN